MGETGATPEQIESAAKRAYERGAGNVWEDLADGHRAQWIDYYRLASEKLVPPDCRIVPASALPNAETVAAMRTAIECCERCAAMFAGQATWAIDQEALLTAAERARNTAATLRAFLVALEGTVDGTV